MNKSQALALVNSLFTRAFLQAELSSLLDFAATLDRKDELRTELLHRLSHWAKLNKSRKLGIQTFKLLNEIGSAASPDLAIKGVLSQQKLAVLAFCNLCLYEQLQGDLIAMLISSPRPYPYQGEILRGLGVQFGMSWLRGAKYAFFHKGLNFLIQQSFKLKLKCSKELLAYFFQQFQFYKKDLQQLSSTLKLLYYFSSELSLPEHSFLLSAVLADQPFLPVHTLLAYKFDLHSQSHRLALLVYLSAVLEKSPQLVKSQKLNQTVRHMRANLITSQSQFFIKSSYNAIQRIKRQRQPSVDTHVLNELQIFLIGLLPGKWNNQQLSILSCLYFSMKYYVQKGDWHSLKQKIEACRSTLLNQHTYFASSICDLTLVVCKRIQAESQLYAYYLPFFSVIQQLSQSELGSGIFKIIYYVATANKKSKSLNQLTGLVGRGLQMLLAGSTPAFDQKETYDGLAKILFKVDLMCVSHVISKTSNYSLLDNLTLKLQQQLIGYIGSCMSKQSEVVREYLLISKRLSLIISTCYKVLLRQFESCLIRLRLLDFIELVAYQLGRSKELNSHTCPSEFSLLTPDILNNLFNALSQLAFSRKTILDLYRNLYSRSSQRTLLQFLLVSAKLLDYSYVEGQSRPFEDPLQQAIFSYQESIKNLTAVSHRLSEDSHLEVGSSQNLYMLTRVCSLLEVYAWIFQFPQINQRLVSLFRKKGLLWQPSQSTVYQCQQILQGSSFLPGAKISLLKRSIPRRQQLLLQKINLVPEKSKNRPAFLTRIKKLLKVDESCQQMLDKRARSGYEQHSFQLIKLFQLCAQNQQYSLIKHLHNQIASFFLEKNDLLNYLRVVELVLPLGFISDFIRVYSSFVSLIDNIFSEAEIAEFKGISKVIFSNRRSSCCRSSTLSQYISFHQGQPKLVSQLKRCLCVFWTLSPLDVTFRKLQAFAALSIQQYDMQVEQEARPKQLLEQLKININNHKLQDLRLKFVQAFTAYKLLRQQTVNDTLLQLLQSLSQVIFNLVFKLRQTSLGFNRHMLQLRQEVNDYLESSLCKHPCLCEPSSLVKQQDQFWLAMELNQNHPRVKKSVDATVSLQNINQFKVSSCRRKDIPNVDSAFLCFTGEARFTLLKFDSSLKTFSVFRNVLNDYQAMDALNDFKEIIKSASRELTQKVTNKSLWWRKRQKNQKALSSALQRVKRHFRLLISLTEGCLNQQDSRLVKNIDSQIPPYPKRKRLRVKTIEVISLLFKSQFSRPEFLKLLEYALANLPFFKFLGKQADTVIGNLLNLPKSYIQTKRPLSLGLPACLHSFPWQSASERPVYRILIREHTDLYKRVSLQNAFYEINPENNLNQITNNFEQFIYKKFPLWVGSFNQPIHQKDFETLQVEKNLFVYMGHGSGKHVPAITSFLLGCCSSQVYNQFGQMNKNIARIVNRAAPSFMGCLWTVTSTDLDIFSKKLLDLKGDLCTMIKQSREEMRMKNLNGASIVVYGRPVIVQ